MPISFDKTLTQNFDEALRREWLETNGLGGWASSTLAGAHTRRYHGLLVAALHPPVGRMVLLSKLEEALLINNQRFELSCNRYPGAVHPRGFEYLDSFTRDLFPVFEYEAQGVRVRKTIAASNGENTTLILYEVLHAPSTFEMELRPFIAYRDYHSMAHANDAIRREARFEHGLFRAQPYAGTPELFLSVPEFSFSAQPEWYYNFEYRLEQYRGLDAHEDLFTYGTFKRTLQAGDRFGVIASLHDPTGRDAFQLFHAEKLRREKLCSAAISIDAFAKTLTLAADQFIVRRGENLRTIIAGYHWFSDWGRDTMIALPGICLSTGRFEDARKILRAFAQSTSQGMLPNRFPDAGEQPEYNTVDATLWFFVAIYKYLEYTNDVAFVREELMPTLRDIISWHERGTRYNIHVDTDGLLYAGAPGVQLTWMDAKVGDWVVTPRSGKAVEINALWYNALAIYAELARRFGNAGEAESFTHRAKQVQAKFNEVFWNESAGALYDYLEGESRLSLSSASNENRDGAAIRPNQIFALSLPFPLLEGRKAQQVLKIVEEQLYTPVGLRSLAANEPGYRTHYGGDQWSRDSAYHQGTVWSWLLGPFITALIRVEGEAGRQRARQVIDRLKPHLLDAGLGTVSEIFDAEPPHAPRGCMAQAWSVGELLRAYLEELALEKSAPSA
ncbi:glycogen debranching enzyme N-terminal domain-containing protein [candidate division KSB1 bacterium]|nr:glycogen debranching enzyme N-terminal domain-containing protein [candidate division KSB1 bacterium]